MFSWLGSSRDRHHEQEYALKLNICVCWNNLNDFVLLEKCLSCKFSFGMLMIKERKSANMNFCVTLEKNFLLRRIRTKMFIFIMLENLFLHRERRNG